jgi:hypothetical protein
MLRVIAALVLIAVYIYGIIDVSRTPAAESRTLPKWLWLVLVLVIPVLGTVLWLFLGRNWTAGGGRRSKRGPKAPDDDPRFLAQLDQTVWSQRMRRRREGDAPSG